MFPAKGVPWYIIQGNSSTSSHFHRKISEKSITFRWQRSNQCAINFTTISPGFKLQPNGPLSHFLKAQQQPRVTVLLPHVLSTVRLPKHGETDTPAARVRWGPFHSSLAKTSATLLPQIPPCAGTQRTTQLPLLHSRWRLLFPFKCYHLPNYIILYPRRTYFDTMKCS
jgi:hypothetical protein